MHGLAGAMAPKAHRADPATLCRMKISQILSDLKEGLARLDQAIAALDGGRPRRGRPPKSHRLTMSPAARKRISAAMKLRWAQRKGKSGSKGAASQGNEATSRRPMSPAARKKLSAMAKARWAARKKAGATSL